MSRLVILLQSIDVTLAMYHLEEVIFYAAFASRIVLGRSPVAQRCPAILVVTMAS